MSFYTPLRQTSQKKGIRLRIAPLLSALMVLAAVILFGYNLVRFIMVHDQFKADITVAGVPVGGLSFTDAAAVWESVYNQPVQLDFAGSPLLLDPPAAGFQLASQQMQDDLKAK